MWGGAMQESSTSWDLRTIDYTIDSATKTYVFFLLVVVIWSVVTSVRFWWTTTAFRGDSRVNLSKLWASFAKNDLEEVRRLSSKIAKRLPEFGLSAWSSLKAEFSNQPTSNAFQSLGFIFNTRSPGCRPPARIYLGSWF